MIRDVYPISGLKYHTIKQPKSWTFFLVKRPESRTGTGFDMGKKFKNPYPNGSGSTYGIASCMKLIGTLAYAVPGYVPKKIARLGNLSGNKSPTGVPANLSLTRVPSSSPAGEAVRTTSSHHSVQGQLIHALRPGCGGSGSGSDPYLF
jgi:hypothetical protein